MEVGRWDTQRPGPTAFATQGRVGRQYRAHIFLGRAAQDFLDPGALCGGSIAMDMGLSGRGRGGAAESRPLVSAVGPSQSPIPSVGCRLPSPACPKVDSAVS